MSLLVTVVVALGCMSVARAEPVDAIACPVGHIVAQSIADITVSGCSLDIVALPDAGADDFQPCCDIVTACYQVCQAPKTQCDKLGKTCVANLCKHSNEKKGKCDAAKASYLASANMFNINRFYAMRNVSCDCVAVAGAAGRYLRHAESILRRGAPKKAEERLASLQRSLLDVAPENVGSRGWRELLEIVRGTLKGLVRRPDSVTQGKGKKKSANADDDDL
jgi:hypothetical protein